MAVVLVVILGLLYDDNNESGCGLNFLNSKFLFKIGDINSSFIWIFPFSDKGFKWILLLLLLNIGISIADFDLFFVLIFILLISLNPKLEEEGDADDDDADDDTEEFIKLLNNFVFLLLLLIILKLFIFSLNVSESADEGAVEISDTGSDIKSGNVILILNSLIFLNSSS